MTDRAEGPIDAQIESAVRNVAKFCRPTVRADGAVWELTRRWFGSKGFDDARLRLLTALLQSHGQAYLVLGDYDPDLERNLVQLGANPGGTDGVWIISRGIDIATLDRASLYLGSWQLLTSPDLADVTRVASPDLVMHPARLADVARRNGISAMVASDTDDDRWLVFLNGLDLIAADAAE
jgi:hypothetical protein